MSGIPSSAGSSPGTTKNLHLVFLSLYLNLTVHTLNCLLSDWLYVYDMTELFLWHAVQLMLILEIEFGIL